jgi:hypothetical protein
VGNSRCALDFNAVSIHEKEVFGNLLNQLRYRGVERCEAVELSLRIVPPGPLDAVNGREVA